MTSQATGTGLQIVVGVDGSPSSHLALEWAIAEAARCSADLEVAVAWEPPEVGLEAYEYVPSEPTIEARASERAQQIAEVAAEQARRQLPADHVHVAVLEGGAAEWLVTRSKDADMLVVGSRGRGGFAGLLLGSVSQQCVIHASCPVVVVRSGADNHHGRAPWLSTRPEPRPRPSSARPLLAPPPSN